ncbi:hypothetical protein [Bacillus sp. CECT 9360]|uniref:hypothetical protein n=1 Tax=Bacillus sp. CECT 9360 TaxID=2845821 RepID=UPI001E50F3E1|nr:hypothetical protein [Bacillus sp. CECT 9360]CAH0344393.1 hypothetical protein BCI9360_00646 [Bacillus sp. CECT 9360]
MIIQECLRYYKSKFTLLLTFVLIIIVGASYYSTYVQKIEWVRVLHSGAEDVNLEKVAHMVSGYTGSYYFESFLFSSDYNVLAVIILIIGFGISIGSNVFKSLNSNYGTMIVTRMSYKNYLIKILMAQVIYISTYIMGFFVLVFILTIIFLKGGLQISSNSFLTGGSVLEFLGICTVSVFHMVLYIIVLMLITTVSPLFLKNKYIIQLLPFLIVIFTYFIANVLGNISDEFAFLTSFFVLDNILFNIKRVFISSQTPLMLAMTGSVFIGLCVIAFFYMYKANIKKFGRDYIS